MGQDTSLSTPPYNLGVSFDSSLTAVCENSDIILAL